MHEKMLEFFLGAHTVTNGANTSNAALSLFILADFFQKKKMEVLINPLAISTHPSFKFRKRNDKIVELFNPLSANPTKWSNTLKQFVGSLPTNCLSVFDHFVGLALEGLILEFMLRSIYSIYKFRLSYTFFIYEQRST